MRVPRTTHLRRHCPSFHDNYNSDSDRTLQCTVGGTVQRSIQSPITGHLRAGEQRADRPFHDHIRAHSIADHLCANNLRWMPRHGPRRRSRSLQRGLQYLRFVSLPLRHAGRFEHLHRRNDVLRLRWWLHVVGETDTTADCTANFAPNSISELLRTDDIACRRPYHSSWCDVHAI